MRSRGITCGMALLLIEAGCAAPRDPTGVMRYSTATTSPTFARSTLLGITAEATPVVYNGTPMAVIFNRDPAIGVEFRDFAGNTLIASRPWDHDMGCALVEGSRMYLFATTSADPRTDMAMTYSDDLVNWSVPQTIYTATPGQLLFNCSVTKDATGYVMAYETLEPGRPNFSFRFFRSADLITWTPIGVRYSALYTACPTIRYIEGTYYLLFLMGEDGSFVTRAAKTTDFVHFDQSGTVALSPAPGEGNNASDVDIVEYQGQTYITYITGDQHTWGDVMLGQYNGTMKDFFLSLWP